MPKTPRAATRAEQATWADRLLAVAGGGEAPDGAAIQVDDFRRFLVLYGAVRSWMWVSLSLEGGALLVPLAVAHSLAAAMAFVPRGAEWAARGALAVVLGQVVWVFPLAANHLFLELVCLVLVALPRRGDAQDAGVALAGLRWTTALVLFHTGLQKVFYENYFRGDFLALMAGADERFGRGFRILLSGAELERLASLDRSRTGAGPFRVASPLLVVASNAVWIAELCLPALLLSRRLRVWGVVGGVALMVGIQVVALEIGFALLFVNLLLLFLPGRWNARALPFAVLLFLWALGAAAGWLPGQPVDWNLI